MLRMGNAQRMGGETKRAGSLRRIADVDLVVHGGRVQVKSCNRRSSGNSSRVIGPTPTAVMVGTP